MVNEMIRRLECMCHDTNFNKEEAGNLMHQIDVNVEFERDNKFGYSYNTTLQAEAIDNHNIEMLSLLLKNGADPNQIYDNDESELWNLQYISGEAHKTDEIRLKMAQLLLEYGANPNMNPSNEPEDLFEWVWYAVKDESYGDSWIYRSRFFILLVAYGGKTQYWEPKILKSFDKSNMKKYRFYFLRERINDYCAKIVDDHGEIIAYI